MNSFTNLREAFLVFLALTVIAIFNAGQTWEREEMSLHYATQEINQMLGLDEIQVRKIRTINAAYEEKLSGMINADDGCVEGKLLLHKRNELIMEVLNERQKRILHAYCTNLVSSNEALE